MKILKTASYKKIAINDQQMYGIDNNWGVPKEQISCPSCGKKYGHHKTTVCMICEECSLCCRCKVKNLQPANVAIPAILAKS